MKLNFKALLIIALFGVFPFSLIAQVHSGVIRVEEQKKSVNIVPLSSLLELKHIIPLETKKTSIIGNMYKVKVFKSLFYILDSSQRKILVFDLSGNYIKSIGSIGKGYGEVLYPVDMDIHKDRIFLLDKPLSKIIIFDLNGSILSEVKIPNEIEVTKFISLDNDNILLELIPIKGTLGFALAELSPNGQIINRYLPNKSIHFEFNLALNNRFHRTENGSVRYIPIYGNVIYNYYNGKVDPFIEVVTNHSIMNRFELEKADEGYSNIVNLMRGFWGMSYYGENESFVCFMYQLSDLNSKWILLKKENGRLIQKQILPQDDYFKNLIDLRWVHSEKKMVVLYYNPGEKPETVQEFKNYEALSYLDNEVIRRRIAKLDINSNPVLLIFESKN